MSDVPGPSPKETRTNAPAEEVSTVPGGVVAEATIQHRGEEKPQIRPKYPMPDQFPEVQVVGANVFLGRAEPKHPQPDNFPEVAFVKEPSGSRAVVVEQHIPEPGENATVVQDFPYTPKSEGDTAAHVDGFVSDADRLDAAKRKITDGLAEKIAPVAEALQDARTAAKAAEQMKKYEDGIRKLLMDYVRVHGENGAVALKERFGNIFQNIEQLASADAAGNRLYPESSSPAMLREELSELQDNTAEYTDKHADLLLTEMTFALLMQIANDPINPDLIGFGPSSDGVPNGSQPPEDIDPMTYEGKILLMHKLKDNKSLVRYLREHIDPILKELQVLAAEEEARRSRSTQMEQTAQAVRDTVEDAKALLAAAGIRTEYIARVGKEYVLKPVGKGAFRLMVATLVSLLRDLQHNIFPKDGLIGKFLESRLGPVEADSQVDSDEEEALQPTLQDQLEELTAEQYQKVGEYAYTRKKTPPDFLAEKGISSEKEELKVALQAIDSERIRKKVLKP